MTPPLTDRELALIELAYGRGQRDAANRLKRDTEAADTVRGDWLRAVLEQYMGLPRLGWTGEWDRETGRSSHRAIGPVVLPTGEADAACAGFEAWRVEKGPSIL